MEGWRMRKSCKSAVLALTVLLGVPGIAFAYIDPNTGGMLFQALATAFALLSGVALVFSRQIRAFFGRARRSIRQRRDAGASDAQATSQQREGD